MKGVFVKLAMASLACLLALASPMLAAERAAEFLEGLRQRGWHDVALEYLDQAADDPLATEEFLERIDFERAVTQVALAKGDFGDKRRAALLEQATTGFQQFAARHPDSPYTLEALGRAGKLLTERALRTLAQVARLPAQAQSEQKRLRVAARATFAEAAQAVAELLETCQQGLDSLPQAAALQRDPEARATRKLLQTKQAEGRFLAANLRFDKARTYPHGSDQEAKAFDEAAQDFAKLSKDYDGKLVGYYGRLYEGRCRQAAGDLDAALDCYEDLVSQPSGNAEFRTLVARAYRHRAESLLAGGHFDQAIDECRDWLSAAHGDERRKKEWLAVAFRLAGAYQAKAKDSTERGEASRLRSNARKLYREIAKQPGEFQKDARVALASTGVGTKIKPVAATSFGDAFVAGKEALDQMNSSKLASRLAAENNPEAVEDLSLQADQNKKAAMVYFQKSLRMADNETPLEQLLAARYYLCWLYWEDERLNDAAVMGEFLARRYPESKFALVAARLALAAQERVYHLAKQSARSGSNRYESERLASIAQWIFMRWPESEDAGTAMNLLVNIALSDGRLAEAERLLEKLPAKRRAAAELSLGGSLWVRSLQTPASSTTTSIEETTQWKRRAKELLRSGFENLRGRKNPSTSEATGVLYLVQLLLAEGEAEEAVEVLEDPTVGPLTLVNDAAGEKERPEFARETYKAALRAYVSVEPPRREQALQMMEAIEGVIGNKGDAQQQLTNIYVSLGLQLQRQVSEFSASGKTKKANAVAALFEDLLNRVTNRGGTNDWKVRNWIAQTNLQLGQGLRGKEASRYLEQAEQIDRKILADVKKDAQVAPNQLAVLGVKKRLGDCLQAQEKFEQAFEQYTQILVEKPNMLKLQQATATALQDWGVRKGSLGELEKSIFGTLPQENRKNLVWGWLRLAKVADYARKKAAHASAPQPASQSKVAKYQDIFFEARYHAAQARFETAKISGGAQGEKYRQTAKRSIESMKRLYPDMGGSKWQQAFNELLQQISLAGQGKK